MSPSHTRAPRPRPQPHIPGQSPDSSRSATHAARHPGRRIALLGSTGSIGRQTLEVVRALRHKGHSLTVVALTGGRNLDVLRQQIAYYRPRLVAIENPFEVNLLKRRLGKRAAQVELLAGEEGLRAAATYKEADLVVNALVGAVGLFPSLAALRVHKVLALANKESLVIGGHLLRKATGKSPGRLIPIDSEPSALYQLLQSTDPKQIARAYLTASGGALRAMKIHDLDTATAAQALQHPTWRMGRRITVDSATLVNKGFEVIEAHWLLDLPYNKLEVLIHPQSVIHGLIQFTDGSVWCQLSPPDMRLPIQHALTGPRRVANTWVPLEFKDLQLSFDAVDPKRYPAFETVVRAGQIGGTMPAAINAADEVLVGRFLNNEIPFGAIAHGLRAVLEQHKPIPDPILEEILAADRWARELAEKM